MTTKKTTKKTAKKTAAKKKTTSPVAASPAPEVVRGANRDVTTPNKDERETLFENDPIEIVLWEGEPDCDPKPVIRKWVVRTQKGSCMEPVLSSKKVEALYERVKDGIRRIVLRIPAKDHKLSEGSYQLVYTVDKGYSSSFYSHYLVVKKKLNSEE